jgi:hypothetical protein
MLSKEEKKAKNLIACKNYRKNNKEKRKESQEKWLSKNLEKRREYEREYRQKNKLEINAYKVRKRKESISYKLSCYLRTRIYQILQRNKSGSAVRDLGCSLEELKKHIESKWQSGMSWENYGTNGWHIDHIIPLVSFNLADREQFLRACHYTNLQPLWAEENLSKGGKIL